MTDDAAAGRSHGDATGMIEARAPTEAIRRAYDLISFVYARLAGPLERKPRMLGLDRARIHPGDWVLEVAVGPGLTLVEIVRRVGPGAFVYGVDLSPGMLRRSRHRLARAGHTNVILRRADARALPFPEGSFDVVYSSYMLDLIPLAEIPAVLAEFRRVLKPGGRLVLVNFTKGDAPRRTWYERVYEGLPAACVPYLLGGCRPVVLQGVVEAAGFGAVEREFVRHALPSEIVVATKPPVGAKRLAVVLVSGACCVPGMAALDEQARRIVEQAIRETGVVASVQVMPATGAFFGGAPRDVVNQLLAAANRGRMPVPAVLVGGKPVSFGVPSLEQMKGALLEAGR